MKFFYVFLMTFFITTSPGFAQAQQSANDIVLKMQHDLNLSDDQVTNITQIVERYVDASNDLQKSVADGTINPSAVDSQKQQIKAAEDQGISQYLRPDQLTEWNNIQQMNKTENDSSDDNTGEDDYSNLPKNNEPQNQ